MSWADGAIAVLKMRRTATIKPHGNSMTPRVVSGQTVTVRPVDNALLRVGDVVLVKVKGVVYLHLIKQIRTGGGFLIGNNKGRINGWVDGSHIYGKADV